MMLFIILDDAVKNLLGDCDPRANLAQKLGTILLAV